LGAVLALCLAWAIVATAPAPRVHKLAARAALPPVGTASAADLPLDGTALVPESAGELEGNALDCVIEPDRVIELGSPVPGVIDSLHVSRGESVEEGQVVAELESLVEWAQVAVAKARAETTSEVRSRAAQLSLEERQNERSAQMFEGRAISIDAKDQAETDVQLAELELELARDRHTIAKLELDRAYADAHRRRVSSPIAGIVVEQMKFEGERVSDTPIVKIVRLDPLRVRVVAPSHLYGTLRPGDEAVVEAEAPLRRKLRATIDVIDPIIDATSDTFNVELTLPNPNHSIPSGLHCRAQFQNPRDLARR
jgi:RND family efflux transporter MFP subunit